MKIATDQFTIRSSDWPRRAALTLLEMMVAVTLLAVIMVSLLMMFNQTQKALHIVSQQTDVFEATRATIQRISRDLAEVSDFNLVDPKARVTNCYSINYNSPLGGGAITLPSGTNQFLDFGEAFWLTRANDEWTGLGYFVLGKSSGIGTLYRYSTNSRAARVPRLIDGFLLANSHPVMDGVVHFSMSAVSVTNQSGFANDPVTTFERAATFDFPRYYSEWAVVSNSFGPPTTNRVDARIPLPAFIDLEFGVLEPAALKQYQALTNVGGAVAQNFLLNHVGQVHFFRERVPVRNFVNPYRSNEAP